MGEEQPLHRLLRRQLRRHLGVREQVPAELQAFVAAVDAAYKQSDADREMVERSLELSSEELVAANRELRKSYDLALQHARTQEALRRSEKQLRQSEKLRALGQLVGGIAHDFNNVLYIVLANVELLKRGLKGSPLAQKADRIEMASRRASQLVERILTFSRGQEQERLEPVLLHELVGEALALLEATLSAQVRLERELEPVDPVRGNPSQLHRMVLNLCTNAAQALNGEAGRITVRVSPCRLGEDPAVRLEVEDTGCGMDAATQERIFEPFFTTKEVGEGTGLGLAMAHGVVRAMKGSIEVESEVGRGTCFRLRFPVCQGRVSPPAEEVEPIAEGAGLHVLLVDDEALVLEVVTELLRELGYRVTGCNHPQRALETFRATPGEFDLMMTDRTMPGLSGVQLATEVHTLRAELPVVLVTGWDADMDLEEFEASGISAVLRKPIGLAELDASIRHALALSR